MSLSSSLFTGTSGLTNMGNAMQVVGNNISNVNTVGFKAGRTTFADTLSQTVATTSGSAQVGRGMSIGSVDQTFDTGSFESTGNSTDLSIGGDGFFVVRQSNSENVFYTRAGNFSFDNTGQLVNPEGYVVQGWELDKDTGEDIGSITDIVLDAFTSSPEQSSQVSIITNLDSDAESQTQVLSNSWDSSETTYMDSSNYEYQSVVKVYDALGSTHDITVYYDKKTGTDWEYVVTCDPSEDNRNLVDSTDSQGLLARGTIEFSESSGDIVSITMEEFTGRIGNVQADGVNNADAISFQIEDTEPMGLDGYGFELEFDGAEWSFTTDGLPEAYSNAQIVYSDDQTIDITLDNTIDLESDLRIELDLPAVANNSFGFDINDPSGLHVQGVEGLTYFGDTANDNTTLEINAPEVMTQDVSDVKIVWNPTTETWSWSNPALSETEGTLVSDVTVDGSVTDFTGDGDWTDDISYNDSSMMTMASSIELEYDVATGWGWNYPLQETDFTDLTLGGDIEDTPTLEVDTAGPGVGMDAGAYSLTYASGTWTSGGTATIVSGDESSVTFSLPSGAVATYSFDTDLATDGTTDGTVDFTIVPSAPAEYPDAKITGGITDVEIDFDGDDSVDLTIATATVADDDTFSFDVAPGVPPAAYANATLKGDKDRVVIDLDGSGNADDKEDIVFSFTDSLKSGSAADTVEDRSEITFDILGSTAWREQSVDEIETTGYFSFNADFLGGEFGSTEMDIEFDIGSQYDGANFINDSLSSTQYARSSSTTYQDADGYSAGDLESVSVASDGIMTGVYSNGELIPLFRVGLAKFLNNNGLSNSGGNLFSETRDSGSAITNIPGENGLGTISPNSLEMSNVDISEELVKMITTQRGFQANSKTITTVDEMMQTVINMK